MDYDHTCIFFIRIQAVEPSLIKLIKTLFKNCDHVSRQVHVQTTTYHERLKEKNHSVQGSDDTSNLKRCNLVARDVIMQPRNISFTPKASTKHTPSRSKLKLHWC